MSQFSIIKQMNRQVLRGSGGDYQADEQAGVSWLSSRLPPDEQADVTRLSWPQSSRRAGRCRAAQFSIIKHMNRNVSRSSVFDYQADEQEVSRGSAGDYQKDEQAGVVRLSSRLSSR